MDDLKNYLIPFIVGVAFIASGIAIYQIGRRRGYDDALALPHKADTVWQDKPVYIDKPVPVVQWRDREKIVYVPVKEDSLVYVHDTTFMPLPREFKQYSGENYTAQVSGIDPSLDWLNINQKTAYITNTVEKPIPYDWTLSAFGEVGYPLGVRGGVTFDKQVAGPLRWYLQGGYEYTPARKGPFVEAGARLQILKK